MILYDERGGGYTTPRLQSRDGYCDLEARYKTVVVVMKGRAESHHVRFPLLEWGGRALPETTVKFRVSVFQRVSTNLDHLDKVVKAL